MSNANESNAATTHMQFEDYMDNYVGLGLTKTTMELYMEAAMNDGTPSKAVAPEFIEGFLYYYFVNSQGLTKAGADIKEFCPFALKDNEPLSEDNPGWKTIGDVDFEQVGETLFAGEGLLYKVSQEVLQNTGHCFGINDAFHTGLTYAAYCNGNSPEEIGEFFREWIMSIQEFPVRNIPI